MLARKMLTILVSLGVCCHCGKADSGLPLIQISHDDVGDDYPEMKEEVHLEDFFWTGSGDGPPDYLKKVHTGISKGKEVIVKTETVVATVYVDGNNEIDIPICLDCPPDDGGGTWGTAELPPINYTATDRRYWLLTVMSGFYSQKDNPMLEEKLARLYRLAFTRQQSKHLGINGAQQISGISIETSRSRRGKDGREKMEPNTTELPSDVEILDMNNMHNPTAKTLHSQYPHNKNSELESSSEEAEILFSTTMTSALSFQTSELVAKEENASSKDPADVTAEPWELIPEDIKLEKLQSPPQRSTQFLPQNVIFRGEHVRILIHNITQITEEEVQKGARSTVAYEEDVTEKIDDRPVANQTELIYSVFVNGRPVLAITAANDMKLVTETEAVNVIGNPIFMKAEPYLREPQATPLVPAIHTSGQSGFINSIQNNTALVLVSSIAILLLLLLCLALLLMGRSRSRERQKLEDQRTSSRNELLSEMQSVRPTSTETGLETGRSLTQSRDVGVQNFSFEQERSRHAREPRIHFPGPPPQGDSRRDSLTSTDNTSDSSVYCPINPPAPDVQRMLDKKAATLFDKHKRRHHNPHYDRAKGHEDVMYTSVASDKKSENSRRKPKRRYLSENRVGSLETSPKTQRVSSSGDEVVAGSMDEDNLSPTYENFERNEAFNPHNNYKRNKLLHQRTVFRDKDLPDDTEQLQATEAINKEIILALQPTERSSDTGSIGSFLSMASVKAFPKSSLPQPLNRVLDPVFVTYYDNVDEPAFAAKKAALSKHGTPTVSTIDQFPSPKAPPKRTPLASQSDNPDPGVVGPIVWERHKAQLSKSADSDNSRCDSPVRDPAAIRNHYEGLLEGAIQLYASQDDLPTPLPTLDFTNKRKPMLRRENRGSSARASSFASKGRDIDGRPATAQPEKTSKSNQSTQPPSPTTGAWGGSLHGSHSPLVRPLSAGPFHHPSDGLTPPPTACKSATNRSDISAAPLIEAIKTELRRFKQDN